jgi:hypothetical protein
VAIEPGKLDLHFGAPFHPQPLEIAPVSANLGMQSILFRRFHHRSAATQPLRSPWQRPWSRQIARQQPGKSDVHSPAS